MSMESFKQGFLKTANAILAQRHCDEGSRERSERQAILEKSYQNEFESQSKKKKKPDK